MEIFKIQIGDVVESTQGRDLGCRYAREVKDFAAMVVRELEGAALKR